MTVHTKEKKISTTSDSHTTILRNEGIPFDASLFEDININKNPL